MPSINLSQMSQQQAPQDNSYRLFDSHLVLSLGILVLVFGAWGGTEWYTKTLKDEIASVKGQIEEKNKYFGTEDVARIIDFEQRSQVVNDHLALVSPETSEVYSGLPETVLAQVEKYILPSVTLTSYSQSADSKTVTMDAVTDEFRNVALQIMSFKSGFPKAVVSTGGAKRGENGKVIFAVTVNLSK